MHIYPWQIDPIPCSIEHRSLENHYTKYVSYIAQCTYTHGRLIPPLLQSSIDLWKTMTPNKFHIYIAQCTYTYGRLTPPLLQSSIDLWKTITPQKFHIYIAECTYTHGRLTPPPPPIEHRSLENYYIKYEICFIYSRMHLYPWQINPPPPPPIEHRSLEHHYTK